VHWIDPVAASSSIPSDGAKKPAHIIDVIVTGSRNNCSTTDAHINVRQRSYIRFEVSHDLCVIDDNESMW